ncbi:hypothetical protein ACFS5L_23710 [Streptomyces phyllanthi]|uniref:Uncharacterized protein n=1 Tax=Streptomyces phyllanthi TaxID=1803180 RepID=A0A5N8W9K6_9ACTN|nr:hypothetical protein [Streptomyces phyllanthi]MPY44167.1 hypothetical protein [Streptomyces phyllanthi]
MRLRLPEERPAEPPTGYKIAHPVLSQDGTRAGFTGVSLGGTLPYGVLDEARCVYGLRHRAPARRCDCGFHCVHDRTAAEALLCTAEHRAAVLLEVSVLGAYIRFEHGYRYARQRVRTATVGACACGATAVALADAGWGRPGWWGLSGSCAGCVRGRMSVSLASFARLAGEGLRVRPAPGTRGAAVNGPGGLPADTGVPELVAEAALLQARLDWFQSRLAQLGERGPGAPPGGSPPQG